MAKGPRPHRRRCSRVILDAGGVSSESAARSLADLRVAAWSGGGHSHPSHRLKMETVADSGYWSEPITTSNDPTHRGQLIPASEAGPRPRRPEVSGALRRVPLVWVGVHG